MLCHAYREMEPKEGAPFASEWFIRRQLGLGGGCHLPSLTEPDAQEDLDTRRSEMLADNRLIRITGLIRVN